MFEWLSQLNLAYKEFACGIGPVWGTVLAFFHGPFVFLVAIVLGLILLGFIVYWVDALWTQYGKYHLSYQTRERIGTITGVIAVGALILVFLSIIAMASYEHWQSFCGG